MDGKITAERRTVMVTRIVVTVAIVATAVLMLNRFVLFMPPKPEAEPTRRGASVAGARFVGEMGRRFSEVPLESRLPLPAAVAAWTDEVTIFDAEGRFLRRTGSGVTGPSPRWARGRVPLPDLIFEVTAAAYDRDGRLYVAASAGESGLLLLFAESRTGDAVGTSSWEKIAEAAASAAVCSAEGYLAGFGGAVMRLGEPIETLRVPAASAKTLSAISFSGARGAVAAENFLATTIDGGVTWKEVTLQSPARLMSQPVTVTALAQLPTGSVIVATMNELLYVAAEGRRAEVIEGSAGRGWRSLAAAGDGRRVYAGGDWPEGGTALAVSLDGGVTWNVAPSPEAVRQPVEFITAPEPGAVAITTDGRWWQSD